jgi:hypothetical protein
MKPKYCFSCFQHKEVEGGKMFKASLKSVGRFRCKDCLAKIKPPTPIKLVKVIEDESTDSAVS